MKTSSAPSLAVYGTGSEPCLPLTSEELPYAAAPGGADDYESDLQKQKEFTSQFVTPIPSLVTVNVFLLTSSTEIIFILSGPFVGAQNYSRGDSTKHCAVGARPGGLFKTRAPTRDA